MAAKSNQQYVINALDAITGGASSMHVSSSSSGETVVPQFVAGQRVLETIEEGKAVSGEGEEVKEEAQKGNGAQQGEHQAAQNAAQALSPPTTPEVCALRERGDVWRVPWNGDEAEQMSVPELQATCREALEEKAMRELHPGRRFNPLFGAMDDHVLHGIWYIMYLVVSFRLGELLHVRDHPILSTI